MLSTGDIVDRYVIDGVVGQGGTSVVYAVRHRVLGTRHALKVLSSAASGLRERLVAEGRAQAHLEHPNIVPVRDVLDVDGAPALLLPLVDGSSLDRLLAEHRPTLGEAAALFRGIVTGMAAVHRAGIVHRDLKPANVLLEVHADSVVPRVADFGLALGRYDPRGRGFAGTPRYAAPEQRDDPASVDARADVWGLGCILFELLAGRSWNRAGPPVVPGPPGWPELLADLLREDPAARPPDATRVRARLVGLPGVDSGSTAALAVRFRSPVEPSVGSSRDTFGTSWDGTTLPPAAPAPSTDAVGREAEIRAVRAALAGGARLVTVHGPAGIGKTRVAAEAVSAPFVELADVATEEAFGAAVGRALGLPADATGGWESGLPGVSGPVVLDGLDRLGAGARASLGRWMRLAPRASWVVTSCQLVGIAGEHVVEVGPLGCEGPDAPAVALFVARASAANPALAPAASELAAVATLVRLLDGIPLAIELAAARTRVLSLAQLIERTRTDRLRVVGADATSPRRSLLAAVEAAYDALHPWEQATFSQIAVFAGGFTLALAEGVVDLGAWPEAPWVVDVLQVLVDRSLVRRIPGSGVPRFGLLAILGDFAERRSPPGPAAELRHGRLFAALVDQAASEALLRDIASRPELVVELGNLLAACRRAVARGDGAVAVPTYRAAWVIQRAVGPLEAGLDLGQAVVAIPGLAPLDRAGVARLVGESLVVVGRLDEALIQLEEAVRVARDAGAPLSEAVLLGTIGGVLRDRGRLAEALEVTTRAEALAEAGGDPVIAARQRLNVGNIHMEAGSLADAERCYAEAAERLGRHGDTRNEASARANLGYVLVEQGRAAEALAHHHTAIEVQRRLGDRKGVAIGLGNCGTVLCLLGRAAEAKEAMLEALALHRDMGNRRAEAMILANLGDAAWMSGELDEAERWLLEALDRVARGGERAGALCGLAEVERRKGRRAAALSRAEEAVRVARDSGVPRVAAAALTALAEAAADAGDPTVAIASFDEALALLGRAPSRFELGFTLCARARVTGDPGHVAEAVALVASLALPEGAPLAVAARALR